MKDFFIDLAAAGLTLILWGKIATFVLLAIILAYSIIRFHQYINTETV